MPCSEVPPDGDRAAMALSGIQSDASRDRGQGDSGGDVSSGGVGTVSVSAGVAYDLQRLDARVAFRAAPFLEELLYNGLLHLSLPLVLWRHGVAGARHRLFLPMAGAVMLGPFVLQAVYLLFAGAALAPWCLSGLVRARVSGFEVAAMLLLHMARAATVAIKYGFYTEAEYERVDAPDLTVTEISSKLMLAGWLFPSIGLLHQELDRSIARTDPRGSSLRLVFPDEASRAAAMAALAEYVPEYRELEPEVRPPSALPLARAPACLCSSLLWRPGARSHARVIHFIYIYIYIYIYYLSSPLRRC